MIGHSPEVKRPSPLLVRPPNSRRSCPSAGLDEVGRSASGHAVGLVELQLGVEAVDAVGLRAEMGCCARPRTARYCAQVDPGGREAAGCRSRRPSASWRPRTPRARSSAALGRFEARLLEGVLVVPHHHRRRVERERQHVALGRRIVAGDGRQVGASDRTSRRLPSSPRATGLMAPLAPIIVAVPTSNTCMMCGALPARKAAIPAFSVSG